MDVPYQIPGGVVSSSSALASPLLLPESKSFLSDSDIFATNDRGFLWCGSLPNTIDNRTDPESIISGNVGF